MASRVSCGLLLSISNGLSSYPLDGLVVQNCMSSVLPGMYRKKTKSQREVYFEGYELNNPSIGSMTVSFTVPEQTLTMLIRARGALCFRYCL